MGNGFLLKSDIRAEDAGGSVSTRPGQRPRDKPPEPSGSRPSSPSMDPSGAQDELAPHKHAFRTGGDPPPSSLRPFRAATPLPPALWGREKNAYVKEPELKKKKKQQRMGPTREGRHPFKFLICIWSLLHRRPGAHSSLLARLRQNEGEEAWLPGAKSSRPPRTTRFAEFGWKQTCSALPELLGACAPWVRASRARGRGAKLGAPGEPGSRLGFPVAFSASLWILEPQIFDFSCPNPSPPAENLQFAEPLRFASAVSFLVFWNSSDISRRPVPFIFRPEGPQTFEVRMWGSQAAPQSAASLTLSCLPGTKIYHLRKSKAGDMQMMPLTSSLLPALAHHRCPVDGN